MIDGAAQQAAAQSPSPIPVDLIGDRIGELREFSEPVTTLMLCLFHEEYDPRTRHAGGDGKPRADVSMVMPFVALLYPHSSTASPKFNREPDVSFMNAAAAQHLASGLLIATRVVNALFFFNVGRPARPDATASERRGFMAQAFDAMAKSARSSSKTAAAYIVMLSSTTERMARAEDVPPTFLPCTNPHHLDGAPPTAVCGTVLDRGFHLSTVQLGQAATDMQADFWHRFKRLTWEYDPTRSGILAEAVYPIDQPSVKTPGVSFLQLPANQSSVRRRQSLFLSSGILDDPKCPVRRTFKTQEPSMRGGARGDGGGGGSTSAPAGAAVAASAAGGSSDGGGGGGGDGGGGTIPFLPEVDPLAPPRAVAPQELRSWRKDVAAFRARLWALMPIVGGAPPRVSESVALRVCAASERARRGVYVHNGIIYTILTYSKTSSAYVGGGRPIMRWMDAKTSTLVLLAMVFLDPLERCMSTADGEPAVDQALLFCDVCGGEHPGRTLDAAQHDGALSEASSQFCGPRVYRQWPAAAAKHVTKVDVLQASLGVPGGGGDGGAGGGRAATALVGTTDGGVVDWGHVLDLQRGHSSSTSASVYAGDPFYSIFNVNNGLVFVYHRATRLWQAGMNVLSDHPAEGLRHPLQPHIVLAWLPRRAPDWSPVQFPGAAAPGRQGGAGGEGRGASGAGPSGGAAAASAAAVAATAAAATSVARKLKAPWWPVPPPSYAVAAAIEAAAAVSPLSAG